SIGFAEVVRREPFHCPRAVGRLFQEGLGGTKCDLAGIGRRGALRRLDRRHSQEHGRKALCDSLYTPKAEQHLELHQHSPSPEAHARKANAAGGSQGLRGPRRQQGWCLLIRAASASARRALPENLSEKQEGMGFLRSSTAGLSESRHLVDRQREEGSDATQTVERAHRRIRGRPTDSPVHTSSGTQKMKRARVASDDGFG